MSDHSAYQEEMERLAQLSDRDLTGLLAGKALADDSDLDDLAAFLSATKAVFHESPTAQTSALHLDAIVEASRALAADDGSEPRRARRKLVPTNPFVSLAAKLAATGALVMTAFCGAAYAGVLPDPVQGAVAGAAGNLGLSLPNPDEGSASNTQDGTPQDPTDPTQAAQARGAEDDHTGKRGEDPSRNDSEQGTRGRGDGRQHGGNQGTTDQANGGNRGAGGQPGDGNQGAGGQPNGGDKGAGDAPNGGNQGAGGAPDGGNPGAGDEPNSGSQGAGDQPSGGSQGAGDEPSSGNPGAGDQPSSGTPGATGEPSGRGDDTESSPGNEAQGNGDPVPPPE